MSRHAVQRSILFCVKNEENAPVYCDGAAADESCSEDEEEEEEKKKL